MTKVLSAGVDTLAVGFSVKKFGLTSEEWVMLADAKYAAQGTMFGGAGTPVKLRDQEFSVGPKGSRGYEYVLVNDDVTVQLAERAESGGTYPEVHITWRSQYLWRDGWRGAYTRVKDWVYSWAEVTGEKVSRADLCIDMNIPLPNIDLRSQEVVSYAKNKKEFYIQHHLKGLDETGYSFGQGKLMCRIYDKLAEIEHSSKAWFQEIWTKNGWNGKSQVTRVEFQARRDFLKTFQIETVEDLDNQLADLWKYFSGWVSLRDKGNDSNRRRWPIKDFWQIVCEAVPAFGRVTGVVRIAQRKPRMESIEKLSRGLMVSLTAMVQSNTGASFQAALGFVQAQSKDWVAEDGFKADVTRRVGQLAFMN